MEILRISPLFADFTVFGKSQKGENRLCFNFSFLARSTLVPSPTRDVRRHSSSSIDARPFASISTGRSPSAAVGRTHISRVEAIRRSFRQQGFSESAIVLLMAGIRPSTEAAYQSAWDAWYHWCFGRETDPLSPHLGTILDYISHLHHSGKAYNTVNIARSMLSVTLRPIDGIPIGYHPLVVKIMKGCYNLNPPGPKYSSTWDPEIVLAYLRNLGENSGLSFADLSAKAVTLLALSTLLRVSELANISWISFRFDPPNASFALLRTLKAQHFGPLMRITLKGSCDSLICPVVTIQDYISRTDAFREQHGEERLFLGLISPYGPVTGNTVGRWIKSILSRAGIDTTRLILRGAQQRQQPRELARLSMKFYALVVGLGDPLSSVFTTVPSSAKLL